VNGDGDGARVLIADDHPPTRAAVREALEADGFVVCGEAGNAARAVQLAEELGPDVCLVDLNMPGDGRVALALLAERVPDAALVVLTVSRDDRDLFDALRAGARGYLLKDTDPGRMATALRTVLAGEAVLPGSLLAQVRETFRRPRGRLRLRRPGVQLSEREWEVLELLNEGLSTAEIAARLYVAPVTVRSHVAAILRKLQVRSRDEVLSLLSD
jgi:DNA-binding NarL/FixJ family response regulator